jgi:HAD superfamily hydrolase (TIGR01509 family)
VFSADLCIAKPDPRIFAKACEGGNFDPAQTLFIDDSPANVQGARDFGLQAYLFDGNVDALRAYLDAHLA